MSYNLRNPAVKRILQELKEIQKDDNPDILAEALEVSLIS
jgi:ubiquitin-conjugating enzyme E2 J1